MRVTPSVRTFECLSRTVGGIQKCGLFRGMSTGVGFKVQKFMAFALCLCMLSLSLLVSLCLPASPSSASCCESDVLHCRACHHHVPHHDGHRLTPINSFFSKMPWFWCPFNRIENLLGYYPNVTWE